MGIYLRGVLLANNATNPGCWTLTCPRTRTGTVGRPVKTFMLLKLIWNSLVHHR